MMPASEFAYEARFKEELANAIEFYDNDKSPGNGINQTPSLNIQTRFKLIHRLHMKFITQGYRITQKTCKDRYLFCSQVNRELNKILEILTKKKNKNHNNNNFRPTLRHIARHTGRLPRSTRGASRGVLECGSGAVVATGCNTHTRVATAEAARSRSADPRATGDQWRSMPAGPYRDASICPRSG